MHTLQSKLPPILSTLRIVLAITAHTYNNKGVKIGLWVTIRWQRWYLSTQHTSYFEVKQPQVLGMGDISKVSSLQPLWWRLRDIFRKSTRKISSNGIDLANANSLKSNQIRQTDTLIYIWCYLLTAIQRVKIFVRPLNNRLALFYNYDL